MLALGKTPNPKRNRFTAILPGIPQKLTSCFLFIFLLIATCNVASAQALRVAGKVTQPSGEPLAGATVSEKGTNSTATTGVDGAFSIAVSRKDPTLVVSYVGYGTKEFKATVQSALNAVLQSSETSLSDVVVVGYGTSRRKDLTGSVASVSGKQLASVPVANAAQALTGKLPGVNVTTQDGRPGASVSIRVRGGGSISQTNEPLFVVDGFPVSSISDIPANQIESIDVLKDASSTAIYGARGANGVIIVTTKSGKSGKLTIGYDNYFQYNKPTKYLPTMSAYDYIAYNWAYSKAISNSYANAWEMLWGIGNSASTYNNAAGIEHYRNVAARNYSQDAYGNSFSHNHNISVGSGTPKTKYLLSMSYLSDDGMKINSWFKRANASLRLEQKLAEKLTLNFDTRFTDIERMGNEGTTSGRGSILSSAYQFRPIATKDVLGELNDTKNTQLGLYDIVLQDRYNPVERMKDYLPESRERSLRSNVSLAWNIIKGLTARSELGHTMFFNRGKSWTGAVYNDYLTAAGVKTFAGNASISTDEGWQLRWANVLNYQLSGLGEAHSVNVTLGEEVINSDGQGISMYGNRYPASFTPERAFAMMNQYLQGTNPINFGISSSAQTPNRLYSYFGRANYTLFDKYLFTATFRRDGSSRFPPVNRWGNFPSFAFGWRMSDENFLKNVSWLSSLKLRASYGSVGNDAISANLWKSQWQSSGNTRFSINEVQQAAYNPVDLKPNPNLKWETTVTRNVGVDFSVFGQRINGTLDVYKNSTKDLLMYTTLDASQHGYPGWFENVGSTSNRGIEFSLGGDILRKSDFNLGANFNINFNRGRVDELAPGVTGLYKTGWGSSGQQPNTGDYIIEIEKPVGQVRGYTYDGWYSTDDFTYANGVYTLKKTVPDIASGIIGTVYGTTAYKPGGQVAYPGVIKFKDINGDGVINEKDVTIIGDMNPKHTGGLSLNSRYKGFDLALNFNWVYGNQIYNANYLAAFYGSKEDGLYKNRLDYLSTSYKIFNIKNGQMTVITDPNELNALNANATTFLPFHENPVVSTLGIEDGSFLRLNTVTLGYNLPASLIKRAKMSSLRIYGSIFNAYVFTNYTGLDPEVNTNMNQGGTRYPTPGLDWGSYPRARSFTAGLNVQF